MSKSKPVTYGTGSVFQKADGRWVGRIEVGRDANGKRIRAEVTAKTEQGVKSKLKERQRKIASEGYTPGRQATVQSWADQWLEKIQTTQRPKPFLTTRSAITKWVIPTIGRRRLDVLTRADLDMVLAAQRDAGRAPATMRRTHTVLVKMLKDAQAYGHSVPPGVLTMPAPAAGKSDRLPLELDQALPLLKHVADAPDPSRWLAVVFQALRTGERLGLAWDHVDFERHEIRVAWQLQSLPYKVAYDPTSGFRVPDGYEYVQLEDAVCLVPVKTDAGERVIPMTSWFEKSLLAWREVAPHSPHGLVWCREDGGPLDRNDHMAEWKALQVAAGIAHPKRDQGEGLFVMHEGRHTVATILRMLGVPDEVIVQIMGHSSMLSTRAYIHADQLAAAHAAMAQLGEHLRIDMPSLAASPAVVVEP